MCPPVMSLGSSPRPSVRIQLPKGRVLRVLFVSVSLAPGTEPTQQALSRAWRMLSSGLWKILVELNFNDTFHFVQAQLVKNYFCFQVQARVLTSFFTWYSRAVIPSLGPKHGTSFFSCQVVED